MSKRPGSQLEGSVSKKAKGTPEVEFCDLPQVSMSWAGRIPTTDRNNACLRAALSLVDVFLKSGAGLDSLYETTFASSDSLNSPDRKISAKEMEDMREFWQGMRPNIEIAPMSNTTFASCSPGKSFTVKLNENLVIQSRRAQTEDELVKYAFIIAIAVLHEMNHLAIYLIMKEAYPTAASSQWGTPPRAPFQKPGMPKAEAGTSWEIRTFGGFVGKRDPKLLFDVEEVGLRPKIGGPAFVVAVKTIYRFFQSSFWQSAKRADLLLEVGNEKWKDERESHLHDKIPDQPVFDPADPFARDDGEGQEGTKI